MPDPQMLGVFRVIETANGADLRPQAFYVTVVDCPHWSNKDFVEPGAPEPRGYAQLAQVSSEVAGVPFGWLRGFFAWLSGRGSTGLARTLVNYEPGQAQTYGPERYRSLAYPDEYLDLSWGRPNPSEGAGAGAWHLRAKGRLWGWDIDAWGVRVGYMSRM